LYIGKNTSSNMAACHGQYCKLAKTLIPGQTSHAFHFIKNLFLTDLCTITPNHKCKFTP